MQEPITPTEYSALQAAYDFFNEELFGGALPHVLVTLQRRPRTRGHFAPDRFTGRVEDSVAHELVLNPKAFKGRTDEEILSTLAHEMVHVWRDTQDSPPRHAYHDQRWAGKMKDIGLQPSTTGAPGGKETGHGVNHYIIDDGPYALAYAKLKNTGFELHWESAKLASAIAKRALVVKRRKASKTKFTCPECSQNAWAKRNALLLCGVCGKAQGKAPLMLAEAAAREHPRGE